MTPGEMQIDGCVIKRGMAEQYLNGPEIRAGFEQMRGIAMAQGVRRNVLLDAGSASRTPAGKPDHLVGDRHVGTPAIDQSREQIGFRLHPSPVGA